MEYDASMMARSSSEGMEDGGMKSERMRNESSGNERERQAVCQSDGRVGMRVGM